MIEKGYMWKALEYGPNPGLEKIMEEGTNYYTQKVLDVLNEAKAKHDLALVYMAMKNSMELLERNLTPAERDMAANLQKVSLTISNA